MRTALLIPTKVSAWTPPLHASIRTEFAADVHAVPADGLLPDLSSYDLVISRLKFRHLAAMGPIDWGACSAFKVHWDEDGFWDGLWSDPRHRALWSENLPLLGFDLLVVTGERTKDYFEQRGFRTALVHKGFPLGVFSDGDGPRDPSIATYGQDYLSRVLARRRLERARIPIRSIKVPFDGLAAELRGSLAALSCTLDARIVGGRRLEGLARRFPTAFIRTSPGPEPMLKFFESAASGCATFTDSSPDLEDLGFVDGENAIIFADIDDLIDKARTYFEQPHLLRRIGTLGAELCRVRHSWDTRAQELRDRLRPFVG